MPKRKAFTLFLILGFNLLMSIVNLSIAQKDSKTLLDKANEFYQNKEYEKAKTLYNEAIKFSPKKLEKNHELLYKLAYCVEKTEGVDNSKSVYRKITDQLPSDLYTAKALNTLGIFHRYESNYDSAKFYYEQALPIAEKYDYSAPHENLRWLYKDKGDYVTAMEYALKALRINEKIADSIGIAISYTNISEILKFQKKYDEAIRYIENSNKIQAEIKDDVSLSRNYETLGNIYAAQEDFKKGQFWLEKALTNDQKKGNNRGVAFSLMQLGALHAAKKEFELSNEYFRKAEPLFELYTTPYDQNTLKINYAFALSSSKQYTKAITTYKDALAYYEKENMLDDMTYCYEQLAFCYEQAGDFKNALVFMKKFRKTSQQVENESVKVKLNELNLQYETEKKERQILQQKNELIENEARFSRYQTIFLAGLLLMGMALFIFRYFAIQRERKLRSAFQSTFLNVLQLKEHFEGKGSMSEKIEITTEVDDLASRINTDLGLITADIDSKLLSSKSFNYTVSHELKRYLSQLEDDISEIGIQSKNNTAVADSLQKVSYLNNLISKLLELSAIEKGTLHSSQFDLEQLINQCIEELKMPSSIVIACSLGVNEIHADRLLIRQIITNLFENAVKYTKTVSNPVIEVLSQRNGDHVEIIVSDNGSGITDVSKREQIFDVFYQVSNEQQGSGLGLAIVKKIIEKHDGYVFAQQNKPTGLKVGFGVPIQS